MASKQKSLSEEKSFLSGKPQSVSALATCTLCSKFFDDPRLLPCLHSFCFKCLKDTMKNCPTCNKSFHMPEEGLSAIPKDLHKQFEVEVAEYETKITNGADISCDRCLDSTESIAITFCCNCCKFLCSRCQQDHKRHGEKYKHELVSLGEGKVLTKTLIEHIPHKKTLCQVHSDEVLKFFCTTCNELVCPDCIILNHNEHKYNRIEQIVEEDKKWLMSLAGEAKSFANKLDESTLEGKKMIKKIQSKKASSEERIRSEFKKLHKALDTCEKSLLARNAEIHFEKETALTLQLESMSGFQRDIRHLVTKIHEALKHYTSVELLSAIEAMTLSLKAIQEEFNSFTLELCKNDSLTASFSTNSLINDLKEFGIIVGCYAGNCTVSMKTCDFIQGEKASLLVTTKDEKGRLYKIGGENVVASLSGPDSEKTEKFKGKDNNDGTYTITLEPQHTGEQSLDIKIGSESIKGSPFLVYIRPKRNYNNLRNFRSFSLSYYPHDVAVSGDKLFIVNNSGNIIVFDKNAGQQLQSVTCQSEYGLVGSSSSGIAAQDDLLYVSDHSHHCVHKLTVNGKYLAKIGSSVSGEGSLQGPRGVCVSQDGELYVTENGTNRISVFKTDGTFIRHITGNLSNPWSIAISPTGNLHVANYGGHYISIHSPEGQFIKQYGMGNFTNPIGIAVSAEGFSFVSENQCSQRRGFTYRYSKLIVFNQQQVCIFTSQAIINRGYGLTCDRDGFIYVCDYQNLRVLKY